MSDQAYQPDASQDNAGLSVPPPNSGVSSSTSAAYNQRRRDRFTSLPLGLGLIASGVLLLLAGPLSEQVGAVEVEPAWAALVMLGAVVLSLIARFVLSGRRERGVLVLALAIIASGAIFALPALAPETVALPEIWPLLLVGVSFALFITYVLERNHERGLIGLGFLTLIGGGVGLLVTYDVIPQDLRDQIADYWPLLLALLGVLLIPLALRRPNAAKR